VNAEKKKGRKRQRCFGLGPCRDAAIDLELVPELSGADAARWGGDVWGRERNAETQRSRR
jgi:hypothetical protein